MTPHEFILVHVERLLIQSGYSSYIAKEAAIRSLDYYKTTAVFKRGAMEETIKYAKSQAKGMA